MTLSPLAAAVRSTRLRSGLTLEQIASAGGVSRSTVAKIEAGETLDPGFGVVARLLAVAGAQDEDVLALYRKTVRAVAPRVVGVGYEGLDQAGLIKTLKREHVTVVADVRLTPLSRKKGLSKTALSEALRESQIDYLHLPALGNPKDNRAGYSDPANVDVRATYRARLDAETAVAQLASLRALAARKIVALLCFENDERLCHRQQILAALGA